MRVLLYGSTPLTERVARAIRRSQHELVGFVPSVNPWIKGRMDLVVEKVHPTIPHDIGLSVQYDKMLPVDGRTFNLHTSRLPEYGGCDGLWHALKENATEQGLTFYRITDTLDRGGVVSRLEYPILPGDDVVALYDRVMNLAPNFVLQSLWLVEQCGIGADYPDSGPPSMYRRGDIDPENHEEYEKMGAALKRIYE